MDKPYYIQDNVIVKPGRRYFDEVMKSENEAKLKLEILRAFGYTR